MRTPKHLTALLDHTLDSYGLSENAKRYDALTRWEEIVGAKVAAVATPERIRGTTLVVRVESAVWKYELTMRSSEILYKIHSFTGANEITEIVWH